MSQIQKTLNAITQLQNETNLLVDSGELPEDKDQFFDSMIFDWMTSLLEGYKQALEEIQNKPQKKKNLITGEFSIRGGYYDFKESGKFKISIFTYDIELDTLKCKEQFFEFINHYFGVFKSDIFLNEWYIDTEADTLKFAFAFQTDLEFSTPKNEISLITGKKLSFGSFHQNKAYFRLPELTKLPDQIWDYPCYGFAIPYSYEGNVMDLLRRIESAAQEGGELADLRAIRGNAFEYEVNILVDALKTRKWKSIFTGIGRYKLLPDGIYKKY